jgi:23S rRNA G2445 N2-methylase RlmL
LQQRAKEQRELKDLSKVTLILNKDKAEILMDTTHEEDLSKHGMRPYVRWGVMNETLAAACILETGILERARRTGKLYLWDPFCGSGSFLLEALMSTLDQPVRNLEGSWPF